LSGRYESGTPIQREEGEEDELAGRPGSELVDFERGRVKPRVLFSLVVGWPVVATDRVRLTLRGSILNLFDRDYAYNFGNPFSGTHFGAPRTAAVNARIEFR
jgi:outer membrane receptor protein involved in Fe transport